MPTKHPRISVTKDDELAAAIESVRSILNGAPEATIVRELALRGAEQMAADEERRRKRIEYLIWWTTSPDSDMDREALRSVRETAWRR